MEARIRSDQVLSIGYTGLAGDRSAAGTLVSKYVFNYPIHSGVVAWQGSIRSWLVGRTRIASWNATRAILARCGMSAWRSPGAEWWAAWKSLCL